MADVEKICPQCAEQVKSAAKICKHCGYKFSAAEMAATNPSVSSSTGKKVGVGCAVLLGFLFLLSIFNADTDTRDDSGAGSVVAADALAEGKAQGNNTEAETELVAPEEQESAWAYYERKDELRNKTEQYARVVSENKVDFNFPYGGGSRLTMTVRKSPKYGQDVIFEISKGQFVCGLYNCKGAISFDGAAESLTLSTPADHSSDVLFATYHGAIIRKLKGSDKTIVELPFYQEGNRQFIFETRGFTWPPKPN